MAAVFADNLQPLTSPRRPAAQRRLNSAPVRPPALHQAPPFEDSWGASRWMGSAGPVQGRPLHVHRRESTPAPLRVRPREGLLMPSLTPCFGGVRFQSKKTCLTIQI